MRRHALALILFVSILGISFAAPTTENANLSLYQRSQQYAVSAIGDNTEDFVDQISNLHSPTDIGTHNVFADLQDYGANYDAMTEGDTGTTDINEYRYVDGVTTPTWTTNGTSPYLNAQDQPTNYIYTASNGLVSGWFSFADTSGTGSGFVVNMSIYWQCITGGDSYPQWELDWTGDGVADASGSFTTQTTWGWANTGTISGLDTQAEINACQVRFIQNKGGGGPEQVNIDAARLGVFQAGVPNYQLDLEVGWASANFDETNEELCIYPVTGGGWPTEDIKVDVWNGAWTNVILDLTPDQWNNVSINSYLTSTSLEIRFVGGTETGDTNQDTWEIDAVLIHTWTPSYAPAIDQAPTLDNPSDGDNMYAQYLEYQVTVYVSDQNGFGDITYLEIGLWDNTRTTEYCRFRYNEDTNTFTEEYDAGTYVSLNSGSSSAIENGNAINATFHFTVDWDFPDSTDLDANCTVIDTQAELTTTWYEVNWDVETRLDYSVAPGVDDGSGTADRGNLDGSFSLTGTVIYYTSVDDFPASTAVDVYVSASEYGTNVGPWSDLTLTSGVFDVTCYADDVVGQDTYTIKIVEEGAGAGGTDLYYAASASDTYIADQLVISISDPPDQRINTGSNATGITVSAIYDYDSSAFDGILALNDTTFDYGTFGKRGYTVTSASGDSHGVTLIGVNDATYCIWDSLTVTITNPGDQRINTGTNATGITVSATYDYDGLPFDGTLTLNNSIFQYGTAQIQYYTVQSASGDSYGITVINSNDMTWCIWDSLTITITDPSDQRQNINVNATGIVVSAVYDYDGTPFDGSLTLNNTQFSYGAAQRQDYTVQSVSGGTYGISAISTNDFTYFIWDSLTISITDPSDSRININTAATGIFASAVYDYDGAAFDGTLTLNNTQFTYSTAQIQWYTVDSASGDSYGITAINLNDDTWCVWDSLIITVADPGNPHIDIDTAATGIGASAVYDYDGAAFDGTLTLNNTQFTYSTAQIQWYTVSSASGDSYGITAISLNDDTWCIWDSLTITITDPSDQRININMAATGITASAVYDYDGSSFDGTLTLNNTQFTYSTAQIQWYTVDSASGDSYGITAINLNDDTWCIWDSVTITITDPTDQRQNVNVNASGIVVTGVYDYDGSVFDGVLTLNNTQFTYGTAQRQDYTVDSISGGAYVITAISSNDVTYFIWDSLTISITGPADPRININTAATGIVASATRDYDGSTFDGTLTLNNTQFTYLTAQIQWYTVDTASGGTYGITAISLNDDTYCIWDSLTIAITDPADQRQNVNVNATGIIVSAVYDYDGATFDGTFTLNNTQFSYPTAQRQDYTVQSVSGGAHGITAISNNDVTYFIWDSLTISILDPSNQRIDINANASGIIVTAVYDYDGSTFDGTLSLNNTQFLYGTSQRQDYTVDAVSGGTHGITAISTNDFTYCIWDSLTITLTNPLDQHIDINMNASGIIASAVYDYDGAPFDGTLTLNNTQFSYPVAQRQDYTVQSVSGGIYGISAISNNDFTYCIWDSLTISIADPSDQRINTNTNASGIIVSAVYDYDGAPFDGTLTLNNTQFSYLTAQRQDYTVQSVSGGAHSITAISLNDVTYCIWDSLTITITGPSDQRIDINTAATGILATAIRDYDGSAFDGVLTLNNTQFTYSSAQIQWYTLDTASGGSYGITAISSNDLTYCIWDSLTIAITGPTDQRININANATGLIVSAVYDYDGSAFDGTFTLNNTQFSYPTAQRQDYTVQSVSGSSHGITAISANDVTYCIWDSLTITITGPTDQRIDVNTNATGIHVTAVYDYDGSAFDGSFTLNNTQFLYGTVQKQDYTVASVSGDSHGITAISTNDATWCIWDRLLISIIVDDATPDNGIQVNFTLTVYFDYDDTLCTTYQVVIQRNSTWWHSFTDSNTSLFVDTQTDTTYTYSVRLVTSESTYNVVAFAPASQQVIWSAIPNTAPTNDADPVLTNPDDGSFMYARYKFYIITSNVSDADGYLDIQYVELTLYDNTATTPLWTVRYTVSGGVFSIVLGSAYIQFGSSYATMSGNNLDITWAIKIDWDHDDMLNAVPYQFVTDGAASDSDYSSGTWDVETRLDYSSTPSLSDDRGDVGTADLVSTGSVVYYGSSLSPLANETDVWVVHDVTGEWSGDLTAGSFSIANIGSSASVRLNTYTFKIVIEGTGSGGTDLYYTTSLTDTFITDRIEVYQAGVVDGRININTNCEVWWRARYQYDSIDIQSGLTAVLNGSKTLVWDSGNLYWRWQESSASPTAVGFDVLTASETTYGLTTFTVSSSAQQVIWDAIVISLTDPTDQRINVGANATGILVSAIYAFDGTAFDGDFTLNNTQFNYLTAQKQGYTVLLVSGDSYGITTISSNDATFCIWDSLTISITDPTDQRQNVNVNATGVVVSAIYDYDSAPFVGTLTLNNTQFSYSDAQIQWYTVDSVSDVAYGISAISVNDVTYFIWDSLTVTISDPADQRVNVGENATGIVVSAVYDYDGSQFGGLLALNNTQFDYLTAQIQWYSVSSASGDSYGISVISTNDVTWCIWDSLTITITDPSDQRININTNATGILVSALYDYDGTLFDGILSLNNTQFSYSTAQIQWYTISSASGGAYDITAISVNDMTFCVWDELIIEIRVVDATLLNGVQENFSLLVKYAYDNQNCTTYQIVISRNSTWWHSFDLANASSFIDTNINMTYSYTTSFVTSESAFDITAFTCNTLQVIWSLAPNEVPVNDSSPVLTNADDTDYLYARYRYYMIITSASDPDGYGDINYVELTLYSDDDITQYWTIRYTAGSGLFSVESGGSNVSIGFLSNAAGAGDTLTITWYIKIGWNHSNVVNTDILQFVSDGIASASDFYETNWNVETRLTYSVAPSLSEDRGDVNTADLIGAGSVTYFGSALSPHSNETDVWVIHDLAGAWSGDLAAGSFSISSIGSAATVRMNTYTFKVVPEGAGSGGVDLYYTTSLTDTFITDRIEIYEAGVVDGRINVNSDCEVWWRARYEYDSTEITSGLTLELTGSKILVWDAGSLYWRWQETSMSPGLVSFDVISANETTYGLSVWFATTTPQQVIWDSLVITITDPVDQRIDVGANATGIHITAVYAYDGALFNGSFVLNNTNFVSAVPAKQGYSVITTSGDDYGITAIAIPDDTYCIWDRVLVVSLDADELYHDPTDDVNITIGLQYEYDGAPVLAGTFAIATYPLTHIGGGVWEAQVTIGSYQAIDFDTLTTCNATLHGISQVNMNSNTATVYWDRLEFYQVSVDDDRINIGASAEIQWSVRLENAGISITSGVAAQMTGPLALALSAGVYVATVTESTVGSMSYSILSASLGEMSAFVQTASDATVVWDRIRVASITATTPSIDVNTPVEIHVVLEYEFDSTSVTDGLVSLDDGIASVPMSYSSAGGYWSASVTKSVAGNYTFSVDSVSGNNHGISSLNTAGLSVEVEWVGAAPFALDPMTLMIIGAGGGIAILGVAIVASRRRRSGVAVSADDLELGDFGVSEPTAEVVPAEPEIIEPEIEAAPEEVVPEVAEPAELESTAEPEILAEPMEEVVEPMEAELPPMDEELLLTEELPVVPELEAVTEVSEPEEMGVSIEEPEIESETPISEEPEISEEPLPEPELEPEAIEEPIVEPEVKPEYPDYDSIPEEFIEPEAPVDLSTLTKKELLELIPEDIRKSTPPNELKRLTKQELISLVESLRDIEE